jgi:flagellar biosynthesis protein FliP
MFGLQPTHIIILLMCLAPFVLATVVAVQVARRNTLAGKSRSIAFTVALFVLVLCLSFAALFVLLSGYVYFIEMNTAQIQLSTPTRPVPQVFNLASNDVKSIQEK